MLDVESEDTVAHELNMDVLSLDARQGRCHDVLVLVATKLEARLSEGHGRVLRAEDWTPWGEHRLKVEQQLCGMQGREHWCVARGLCRGDL